jgi:hypothetical protein
MLLRTPDDTKLSPSQPPSLCPPSPPPNPTRLNPTPPRKHKTRWVYDNLFSESAPERMVRQVVENGRLEVCGPYSEDGGAPQVRCQGWVGRVGVSGGLLDRFSDKTRRRLIL